MTTDSSDYSDAVREYVEIELESSFEFDRLSPDEDDLFSTLKYLE
ncbi:hypothetical protein [Halorussus ruber]|nr:hypothetical protein [Halorussus ruber]